MSCSEHVVLARIADELSETDPDFIGRMTCPGSTGARAAVSARQVTLLAVIPLIVVPLAVLLPTSWWMVTTLLLAALLLP